MIYYGAVAKNRYVIADYTAYDGDFRVKFQKIVSSTLADGSIKASKQDDYKCYVRHNPDGYAFGCVVSALVGSEVPNRFIETMQQRVYQHLEDEVEGDSGSTARDLTKLIQELIVFLALH